MKDHAGRRYGCALVASRRLLWALAGLAAVRVGIALAAVVAEGTKLPGIPAYRWRGLEGDANGYYSAAREAVAAAGDPATGALVAGSLAAGAAAAALLRRRGGGLATQVLAATAGVAGAATAVAAAMSPPGAPVVGWPLLWAVPLAPLRLAGNLDVDAAWVAGVALSLICIAGTVIACGLLGRWATGSDAVGIGAAALFAASPLLTGALAGEQSWDNGTWLVDAGLHLYTEPLSTFLVVAALALLVRPGAAQAGCAGAGTLLGFATAVKLTNGLIALVLAPLVARRHGYRAGALYAAGGLLFAPLVAVYWEKGYVANYGGRISPADDAWSLRYLVDSWGDSTLFTPAVLALLVPLVLAGCFTIRDRWAVGVLLAAIVPTAVVHSFYSYTAIHPRFLFVALPSAFVLWSAGALAVLERAGLSTRRGA